MIFHGKSKWSKSKTTRKTRTGRGRYEEKLPAAYRSTKHIPSKDTGVDMTAKNEPKQYTGDVVIGIAQMHKSNAVPIIKQEDAVDIAKMRR